ncbi:MAG: 1-deoxy-D-xylulose-5-phosphate reductoisomerase [Sutterella wadsworthensis]
MQTISLLGATGSIGRSAVDVIRRHPEHWRVKSAAGGSRIPELVEAVGLPMRSRLLSRIQQSRSAVGRIGCGGCHDVEALAGSDAAEALAADRRRMPYCRRGAAGVAPTFAAARTGKRLMLANKESVVCGGALLMKTVTECGAELFPVDSEHSAVFQCLAAADPNARSRARIILTASGGPFRGRKTLEGITPAMAVKHPKWSMGRKISVDSATLMNKGLEVIEASWLFDFPEDRIDVVVHPESVIHSMVAFEDGAVMAELGDPDMRTPIAAALSWPQRVSSGVGALDLTRVGRLTFEAPDLETFPLLELARETLRRRDGSSIVMNAANEVAVAAFLDERISFTGIMKLVEMTTERFSAPAPQSVEEIFAIDVEARTRAAEILSASEFFN